MSRITFLVNLDRTVHEPGRLIILAILSRVRGADFVYLLRETGLTRGNLSSHMARLEGAEFVTVEKEFVARIPRTTFRLTGRGRAAFEEYRRGMIAALGE